MRRGVTLPVALALLTMPVALFARIRDCATMSCCRRMCPLARSSGAAMPMPCHHNERLPRGFCQLSDSCHGHAHWGLTTLILPVPPPAAQTLALPEASRSRPALASAQALSGFGVEPFEPPRG